MPLHSCLFHSPSYSITEAVAPARRKSTSSPQLHRTHSSGLHRPVFRKSLPNLFIFLLARAERSYISHAYLNHVTCRRYCRMRRCKQGPRSCGVTFSPPSRVAAKLLPILRHPPHSCTTNKFLELLFCPDHCSVKCQPLLLGGYTDGDVEYEYPGIPWLWRRHGGVGSVRELPSRENRCLLYTSDAADEG